ncbi:MAG: hypothetical protein ACFFC6_02020 [Promethearchaeota archaeon]
MKYWQKREMLSISLLFVVSTIILGSESSISNVHEASQQTKIIRNSESIRNILLENPTSGTALYDLVGHTGVVRSVYFSPKGNIIASGSEDGTIRLWNVSNGAELPISPLSDHSSWVTSVVFSPDGKILASGSIDGAIKLWNCTTGKVLLNLTEAAVYVQSIAFSPDGAVLASGSSDNTIKLWNITTKQVIQNLKGHIGIVHSVVFSPDGKTLASGSGDREIKLWDVATGEELQLSLPLEHKGSVRSIDYYNHSYIGLVLASGSADDTIKLWNAENGTEMKNITGHVDQVTSVTFSPIGTVLASGSMDNTVKLWDITTGDLLLDLVEHVDDVLSISISPDGTILASGSADNTIKLWNIVIEDEMRTLSGHEEDVHSVAFSPNGTFASGSADNSIKIWNSTTGTVIENLTGHTGSVFSTSFSPDGTILASGSADDTIRIWNVTTGEVIYNLTKHTGNVMSIAFSPDGTILASGSADDTIKLWDVTSGIELPISPLIGQFVIVRSVTFSPDGIILASGSAFEPLVLWNITSQEPLRSLESHTTSILCVAFSPDGKILASGSSDGVIKLWNWTSGEERRFPQLHIGAIRSVAFSPDGSILASGGVDGSIRLWNVNTSTEIQHLPGHLGGVESVTFSPDGTILASGGADDTITLWPVSPLEFDLDVDGMVDSWELQFLPELDPTYYWDKFGDIDNDGLMNSLEFFIHTNPLKIDSDGDKIPDGWEYLIGYPWLKPTVADANSDADGDLLPASYEFQTNLNPRVPDGVNDKDNDGLTNIQEYLFGSLADQNDSDNDGMSDGFEFDSGLDPKINDSYLDEDGDSMYNLYEFQHGFNATNSNDAVLDEDNDGMPNYWECLMNLDASDKGDAQEDQDNDGMPNLWEFQHGFHANNPEDAHVDADGDWVSNHDEFRGGSNPLDFWSVPPFALSAVLIIQIIILLIITALGVAIFMGYRRKTRNALITRFNAPDYSTALKIRQANFNDHAAYVQAIDAAKEVINQAKTSYMQSDLDKAIKLYETALEKFERLGSDLLIAETVFRLYSFQVENPSYKARGSFIKRFPVTPFKEPLVEAIDYMMKALSAETQENWGTAERMWSAALRYDNLSTELQVIAQESSLKLAVNRWINNPVSATGDELLVQLDNWQGTCENYQYSDSLCKTLLLRARLTLAMYKFDEVEKWLEECLKTAAEANLKIYQEAARKDIKIYLQQKQRLGDLFKPDIVLSPSEYEERLQDYIRKALHSMEQDKESRTD